MIAIWGANGFIGRNLAERLLTKSQKAKCFARSFAGFPKILQDYHQCLEHNFANPQSYLSDLSDCSTIILLVSASGARTFENEPAKEWEQNVLPYQSFLKGLAALGGDSKHILYASSGGTVYGETSCEAISEGHTLAPISPYGRAKKDIEELTADHCRDTGNTYTHMRIANPVGRWGHNKGLVAAAIKSALTGQPLTVMGDGSIVRDYFDVGDLAGAVTSLINNDACMNMPVNIGSGEGRSINQIIDLVGKVVGKSVPAVYKETNNNDVPCNVLNCEKIKDLAGWSATTDLSETISAMAQEMDT